ncbi:MAG: hypothetical protein KF866_05825 [Phycisphaeraceae bacterium]|nr:hypothetical protein [Phycisphaeraceae bacterium]MCW5754513.1 hypothetical protein [Phycisphaeraceae bacterium]
MLPNGMGRLCAAMVMVSAAGYATGQVNPPMTYGGVVHPTLLSDVVVVGPGNDLDIAPPNHPPFDQIPPMPMPEPIDTDNDGQPDALALHDAVTGETIYFPLDAFGGMGSGEGGQTFPGVEGWDTWADLMTPEGFGTMSLQTNPGRANFPWRANCKLIMRFVDQGGNNRFFSCSGTMIDAGVVLTAGHCVYARTATGTNIFAWASEIWVYPAWDGTSGPGVFTPPNADSVIEHYGYTRATGFVSSVGANSWVNDGNFDFDVGLALCYDRSVGALTGTFGWAWGQTCATIQGRTYHNTSYPAESCGGGLHTGRDMYYWFGSVDSCPGNQLQLDTTTGCLTAVWGGMSGSGMYYIDGSNRFVHAVCSNSNRSTIGRYAKLWDNFVNGSGGIVSSIANVRGSGLDIEALQFRLDGSTTIQAGTNFGQARFIAANTSNNNPPQQTYTARVYLSTNNNISAADTLLATWNYNIDFAAMENRTFLVPGTVIPINTPPGTYWMGVEVDAPGDVNVGNNDTDTWDAQQVTITLGLPDTPSGPEPAHFSTNNPITSNLGWNDSARATTYDVYFGTTNPPPFVGNTANSSWNLPNLAFNTTYFWRVVARNSAGNVTGPTWQFTTQATPASLTAVSCDAPNPPNNVFYRGASMFPVVHTTRNDGGTTSSTYLLEFRASTNNIISTIDLLLETRNYASLAPGASRTVNSIVQLPPTMNPGTYYIGTRIVPSDSSPVSWVSDTNTITVLRCPADISGSSDPGSPLYGVPDGRIDSADFFYYLDQFVIGNVAVADLTGSSDPSSPNYGVPDGVVDASDFFFFLDVFVAGCAGL